MRSCWRAKQNWNARSKKKRRRQKTTSERQMRTRRRCCAGQSWSWHAKRARTKWGARTRMTQGATMKWRVLLMKRRQALRDPQKKMRFTMRTVDPDEIRPDNIAATSGQRARGAIQKE
jgi:hypothetical protein